MCTKSQEMLLSTSQEEHTHHHTHHFISHVMDAFLVLILKSRLWKGSMDTYGWMIDPWKKIFESSGTVVLTAMLMIDYEMCSFFYLSPGCFHLLRCHILTSSPACHSDWHVAASGGRGKYYFCDTLKIKWIDSNWRLEREGLEGQLKFSSWLVSCLYMSFCVIARMCYN